MRIVEKSQLMSAPEIDDAQDRKSTRLNSSHSQISYAVFCLKKKNSLACSTCLPPFPAAWAAQRAASSPPTSDPLGVTLPQHDGITITSAPRHPARPHTLLL